MTAGAEQLGPPAGRARRLGIPARARRRRGADLPAHPRRGQLARRIEPHQPERHAMFFRRKAKTARRGESQRLGIAHDLADDEGKIAAAHPFLDREQRILSRARRDMDQPVTQAPRQAVAANPPGAPQRLAVLHPQPGALVGRIGERIGRLTAQPVERESQRQRRSRRVMAGSEDLAMPRLAAHHAVRHIARHARPPLIRAGRAEAFQYRQFHSHRITSRIDYVLFMFSSETIRNGLVGKEKGRPERRPLACRNSPIRASRDPRFPGCPVRSRHIRAHVPSRCHVRDDCGCGCRGSRRTAPARSNREGTASRQWAG